MKRLTCAFGALLLAFAQTSTLADENAQSSVQWPVQVTNAYSPSETLKLVWQVGGTFPVLTAPSRITFFDDQALCTFDVVTHARIWCHSNVGAFTRSGTMLAELDLNGLVSGIRAEDGRYLWHTNLGNAGMWQNAEVSPTPTGFLITSKWWKHSEKFILEISRAGKILWRSHVKGNEDPRPTEITPEIAFVPSSAGATLRSVQFPFILGSSGGARPVILDADLIAGVFRNEVFFSTLEQQTLEQQRLSATLLVVSAHSGSVERTMTYSPDYDRHLAIIEADPNAFKFATVLIRGKQIFIGIGSDVYRYKIDTASRPIQISHAAQLLALGQDGSLYTREAFGIARYRLLRHAIVAERFLTKGAEPSALATAESTLVAGFADGRVLVAGRHGASWSKVNQCKPEHLEISDRLIVESCSMDSGGEILMYARPF